MHGPMPKGMVMAAASPVPPIDSGDGTVGATLTVTWALGPAL